MQTAEGESLLPLQEIEMRKFMFAALCGFFLVSSPAFADAKFEAFIQEFDMAPSEIFGGFACIV